MAISSIAYLIKGEMIDGIDFNGFGVFYQNGFSTDYSETCTWMTPLYEYTNDPYTLQ